MEVATAARPDESQQRGEGMMAHNEDDKRLDWPELRTEGSEEGLHDRELASLRADIRQTRERMGHTVEDIGERLNPERLKDQLKSNLHDATLGKAEDMARSAIDRVDRTRSSISDSIRDNPIPAAMVGIGLGWLLLNGRRDNDHNGVRHSWESGHGRSDNSRYGKGSDRGSSFQPIGSQRPHEESRGVMDRGEDLVHRAGDRVTEMAHDARDSVGDMAERAQEVLENTGARARTAPGDFARETRYRTQRVEDRFEETLYESPLAVGAAAAAIGLAIGLSAPGTRRESEWMGAKRDEVVGRAKEATRDAGERVREVAERVVEEVETTARDAAQEQHLI